MKGDSGLSSIQCTHLLIMETKWVHDPKDGFSLLVLLPSAGTKDAIPGTKTVLMLRMAVLPGKRANY